MEKERVRARARARTGIREWRTSRRANRFHARYFLAVCINQRGIHFCNTPVTPLTTQKPCSPRAYRVAIFFEPLPDSSKRAAPLNRQN